jgi:hypothetical protein
MPVDRAAAETFIWSAARLVDRHRYTMLFEGASADPALAALSGYRNLDGGFGHALEPDLRCPGSQPAATLYALEMLHEAGRLDSDLAIAARAWIASIAASDGGIPNALPGFEPYPHSPWWSAAPGSFLTFALAAVLHAGGTSGDEWLDRATEWCWREVDRAPRPAGYWLKFACAFLDAVPDEDRAHAAIASLKSRVDSAVRCSGSLALRHRVRRRHPGPLEPPPRARPRLRRRHRTASSAPPPPAPRPDRRRPRSRRRTSAGC